MKGDAGFRSRGNGVQFQGADVASFTSEAIDRHVIRWHWHCMAAHRGLRSIPIVLSLCPLLELHCPVDPLLQSLIPICVFWIQLLSPIRNKVLRR
jgi:hypothetical protein